MTDPFEIEAQGESEFVVRLRGDGEETESWFRLSPGLREELGLEVDDEELVRRTVRFLLGHQEADDFPDIVEIEDVVARDALELDGWLRDAAPSDELRRWFGHDPARWAEFRRRYVAELDASPETWAPLRAAAAEGDVVLLYAARDREHNNAVVLRDHLEQALSR